MHRSFFPLCLALMTPPAMTIAQEVAWVQIEARPNLAEARARAEDYAAARQNVTGYALGSGWYGIALGPYTPADAESLLARLRKARAIPQDSFIVDGRRFKTQFFPVGTGAPQSPLPLPGAAAEPAPETPAPEEPAAPPQAPAPAAEEAPEQPAPAAPEPALPDETPREARASEGALSLDEKKELQRALKWAGVYDAAIDGLYGRGTRRSMAAWQGANGYEETGILTTRQRAELLGDYNAVLNGMDLTLVEDDATGIDIELPLGALEFARYDPPFARFESKAGGPVPGAMALLISQRGDRAVLSGLYEVMQTLEIVPSQGERRLRGDGFVLEGRSERLVSHTIAGLRNGEIKGFTLVWPAGDEERRLRVLDAMRASFERREGVLDPVMISPGAEQSTDLVSGLAIRKPMRIRSGIFISESGAVLTAADAATGCGSLQLEGDIDMELAIADEAFALLTPKGAVAPRRVAGFSAALPDLRGRVALAGFPYGGILPSATMTFGTLEDTSGLRGEAELLRLALPSEESELGGPVFDPAGAVIGMLVAPDMGGRSLPGEVAFALKSGVLTEALSAAGQSFVQAEAPGAAITEEELTLRAPEMTALLTCWE